MAESSRLHTFLAGQHEEHRVPGHCEGPPPQRLLAGPQGESWLDFTYSSCVYLAATVAGRSSILACFLTSCIVVPPPIDAHAFFSPSSGRISSVLLSARPSPRSHVTAMALLSLKPTTTCEVLFPLLVKRHPELSTIHDLYAPPSPGDRKLAIRKLDDTEFRNAFDKSGCYVRIYEDNAKGGGGRDRCGWCGFGNLLLSVIPT